MRYQTYLTEADSYKTQTRKDQTGHWHDALVNADGDGETREIYDGDDHIHQIVQWLIQPAHGHIHNLEDL